MALHRRHRRCRRRPPISVRMTRISVTAPEVVRLVWVESSQFSEPTVEVGWGT